MSEKLPKPTFTFEDRLPIILSNITNEWRDLRFIVTKLQECDSRFIKLSSTNKGFRLFKAFEFLANQGLIEAQKNGLILKFRLKKVGDNDLSLPNLPYYPCMKMPSNNIVSFARKTNLV
jgi:hypothetical protein